MPYAECIDCGEEFWREDEESWKRRCYDCWWKSRNRPRPRSRAGGFGVSQGDINGLNEKRELERLRREVEEFRSDWGKLFEHLSFLTKACHPDRNPTNQAQAHEVMVWLNRKREHFRSQR